MNTFTSYGNPGHAGYQKYGINDLSVARKIILLEPGTSIANIAAVKSQATWIALCKNPMATRIHPFPLAVDCKPGGGTTIMAKTSLSGEIPIREDVNSLTLTYNVNPILAMQLRQFNRKKWDVVLVDAFENIIGWTPDGTTFRGFTATSIFFGQMSNSDGAKARENELTINFANPKEWNDSPALVMGDALTWYPTQLDGTTGVNLTVVSSSSSACTIKVTAAGLDSTDPRAAFTGLAKADFTATKDGSSFSLTGSTFVDNGDGSYLITISMTAGVYIFTLVAPASISVAAYNIEPLATCTFTTT
jgi:hypothetical protein